MERTIESLEQDLKSEHDLYLRALADFENYRRRVDREREYAGKEALRRFLLPLLDVIDDLERFQGLVESEASPCIDGVRLAHQKFLKVLGAEGVRPFASAGEVFDPALHEAVATHPAGEQPAGTVVKEVQRGYRWNDELLRSARVVVAV